MSQKKSGLADSPFFVQIPQPTRQSEPTTNETALEPAAPAPKKKQPESVKPSAASPHDTKTPQHRDTAKPPSHDTTTPWYHNEIVEIVRGAVKIYGKEAATYRFTSEEKRKLSDMIYAYRGRDIRTTENEITRIALNFIMADYQENGENSLLHKVLTKLNQ